MSRRASLSTPSGAATAAASGGGSSVQFDASASSSLNVSGALSGGNVSGALNESGAAAASGVFGKQYVKSFVRIRPLLKDEAKKIPDYFPIPRPAIITTPNVAPEFEEEAKAAIAESNSLNKEMMLMQPNGGIGRDLVIVMDPDKKFTRKKGGIFAFPKVFTCSDLNTFEDPAVKSLAVSPTIGDVFADVRQMIECTCQRLNTALIISGGAKSGKMTTMFGDISGVDAENRGLLPRYAMEIFRALANSAPPNSEIKSEVEFVEVASTGDVITDLLLPAAERNNSYPVRVKDEGHSLVTLTNATRITVNDGPAMLSQIKYGLRSARKKDAHSHLVLNFRITEKSQFEHPDDETQNVTKVSKYWCQFVLVASMSTAFVRCIDIAAQKDSGEAGSKQLKIPVRDSMVTRICSEAFGGNCQTFSVLCVSPYFGHVKESFTALDAVSKFSKVRARAVVVADSQTSTFRKLHDEMSGLSSEIRTTTAAQDMVQQELDERQRRFEDTADSLETQRSEQQVAEKRYTAYEIVKIVKALRLLRLRRSGDAERKKLEQELARVDDELRESLSAVVQISQVNEEMADEVDELHRSMADTERSKSQTSQRISEVEAQQEETQQLELQVTKLQHELEAAAAAAAEQDDGEEEAAAEEAERKRVQREEERKKLLEQHEAAMAKVKEDTDKATKEEADAQKELKTCEKENEAIEKEIKEISEAPKKRLEPAKKKNESLKKEKETLNGQIETTEAEIARVDAILKKPEGCSCAIQ